LLRGSRFSARAYLLVLIGAAVVPVWVFAAYVLVSFGRTQQAEFRASAIDAAKQARTVVEGALSGYDATMDALVLSADFADGNLESMHQAATRIVRDTRNAILIVDQDGRILVSTTQDGAMAETLRDRLAPVMATMKSGDTVVTDILLDAREPTVAIVRRVATGSTAAATVILTVPTAAIHEVLAPTVPEGWVVGIADGTGHYVTRSQRHEEVAGKPGLPTYLEQAVGQSGTFTSANMFGETLLAGYVRSTRSGWLYAANVPLSIVEAPMWASLTGVVGSGVGALGLSLLLAFLVGRRITRETTALSARAQMLAKGEAVGTWDTRLREFADVEKAFTVAGRALLERTKELEAVLDTVPAAVWFTYDPAARVVIRNRFAATLMGLDRADEHHFNVPDEVIDTVAVQDGKRVDRQHRPLTRAMRGEHTQNMEFAYVLPDGTERHLLSSASPILDDRGAVLGAVQISLDVTERKRIEEQRRLLAKELSHRVKNNLAVVQAIAQQTLRSSADLDEAAAKLSARLAALGAAHDILVRNSWTEGDLRDVIVASVMSASAEERISLSGPSVPLGPSLVLAVSLAIHELVTNAVKYGALSTPTGKVSVTWELKGPTAVPEVELLWRERGGPPVDPPSGRGFGSRLLKRITASEGGSATSDYDREGLTCTIVLPLRPPDVGTDHGRKPTIQ